MDRKALNRRQWWARALFGLGVSLAGPLVLAADVPPLPVANEKMPAVKQDVAPVKGMTLAECIQVALEHQPALAAHRASLAAAEVQVQALDNLHLAGLLNHEIPIRRKQASLGVVIASAGAHQAEWETIYAVTRNYYTYGYARVQRQVAVQLIEELKPYRDQVKSFLDQGVKTYTKGDLSQIATYIELAEARKVDADKGLERALAALREAMGVDCDFPCFVPAEKIPEPEYDLCCDQVVSFALSRRGEMIQAANVAQVVAMEVDAQGKTCRPLAKTFASVVDLHARPIPQGIHNHEYRPDAIGLEMPTHLVGKKKDRVARAEDFVARAQAVVDKTRNLITLEAQDAFLRWQQEKTKIGRTRTAVEQAQDFVKANKERELSGIPAKTYLDTLTLRVRARFDYHEAQFRYILAVADLQRVTAGAIALSANCPLPEHP
jgi:outer membrane protein TolC